MVRAIRVRELWKNIVIKIYSQGAHYVLSSTNAVYILHEHEKKVLISYLEDSMVRDSLCNMREIIHHELLQANEEVDEIRILPSRYSMRQRHPYVEEFHQEMEQMEERKAREALRATKLTPHQKEKIEYAAAHIEDARLRVSFSQAMEASLKAANQSR